MATDLHDTTERWPDPDHGPWLITLVWRRVGGRPECVGTHIDALSGQTPIGTSVLRRLKLAEMIAGHRERLVGEGVDFAVERRPDLMGMRESTVRRLREVARLYVAAWQAGRNDPTQAVVDGLGVTRAAAGNLVYRARQAGLLPETTPGSAQGS